LKSQANERRIIFLHRQMPPITGQEPIDLVLTPQFYTMKRDDLPIRFAFQARKLAPSLLEEAGDPESLHFEVLREDEGWLYFAYRPDEVENFLKSKGINPQRISRLFFAQQFASVLQHPVLLSGSTQALTLVEDTVTILPASLLHEQPDRFAESLPLPNHSFSFPKGTSTGLLGRKESLWLILAAILLGGAWLIEGVYTANKAVEIQDNLSDLLEEHPALQSGLARRNILEKYRAIDTHQRKIRQKIHSIGSLVSKESKLKTLEVGNQGYRAIIEAPSSQRSTLKEMAKNADLDLTEHGAELQIKGAWQ